MVWPGIAGAAASGVNISSTEQIAFSGRVANIESCTFSDATINWGDGSSSPGQFDAGTTPGVKGAHVYAEEGIYHGSVTYSTDCTSNGVVTFTATIADAALNASGVDISATKGQAFTGVVATFIDLNPGATLSDWTAQINWGDGGSSAGTVSFGQYGRVNVTGTHTYTGAGQAAVNVTISDVGGSTAHTTSTATVTNPPPPLKASFTWNPQSPCQTHTTDYSSPFWDGAEPLIDASASQGAIASWSWTITDFSGPGDTKVIDQPIVVWNLGIGQVYIDVFPTLYGPPSWLSPSDFHFGTAPVGTVVHLMRPPTTVTLTVYDSQGHSDSVQHTITYADPDEPYKVGLHFAFYQGHGYAYKVLMPVSPHECALNRLLGRAGKLLLSGTPTSLTSGHRLTTTVSCPGDCIGTLYALRPGRTKPRVLGKTSFVVHTGKRKHKLTIQLNKTGRLLARASRLRRVTLLVLIRGQKPRAVTVRVRRKNR